MYQKRLHVTAVALCSIVMLSVGFAQEASPPNAVEAGTEVGTADDLAPPPTEANADEVVARAVEAARRPDFKGYNDTLVERQVTEYPLITLKRLKPYVKDPSERVRNFLLFAASRALQKPQAEKLQGEALSLLVEIGATPIAPTEGASPSFALNALYSYLFRSRNKRLKSARQQVNMADLKRALSVYFGHGHYGDEAALLMTLLSSDTTLKPLVDKVAVSQDYNIGTLVMQSAWGAGNAIGALRQKLELGDPSDLKFLTQNILAVNEPNVLRELWKQLNNKKKAGEYPAGNPNGDWKMMHPRACDYVLAAFKWKFDDDSGPYPDGYTFSQFPFIATDEELAQAKARYRPLIAALPQIGEQVGNTFEPF